MSWEAWGTKPRLVLFLTTTPSTRVPREPSPILASINEYL